MHKEGGKTVTVSVMTRLKSIEDIEPVDRPAELNRLGKLIMAELEKTPSIPRALGEVASREGVDRETILLGYRYAVQDVD